MSADPILKLAGVNTFYGASHILQDLTFDLYPREIVGILGRNGVGKTTTLQTILGLPKPRSGRVMFRGEPISGLDTPQIVVQGIGWVPQGHRIFSTLSVQENIELAALKARPGPWDKKRIFETFPRLHTRRNARGDNLSGGEQQMLAIARALIQNPDVFLMDEPSEGLSPLLVQEVGDLIKLLNAQGATVLVVEQNLAFALSIAHRLLIMQKGSIVWSGATADIEKDPSICQRFLGMGAGDEVELDES